MSNLRQTYICAIYNPEFNEVAVTIADDPMEGLKSLGKRWTSERRLLMVFEGTEEKLQQIRKELDEELVEVGDTWNMYEYTHRVLTVLLGCHRQAVRNIHPLNPSSYERDNPTISCSWGSWEMSKE
jgi:hypothetical protein